MLYIIKNTPKLSESSTFQILMKELKYTTSKPNN